MQRWIKCAKKIGFSEAVEIDVNKLAVRQAVRDMCAGDKCKAYGKNWTCPPYCGTLQECSQKIHSYKKGILLQTVGTLSRVIDTKGYRETEKIHMEHFLKLAEQIKQEQPDALCLGSGGCRICDTCAWPRPCRFPQKACSSMEGYGLFVTQVCRENGVPYYYGEKTIAYSACILLDCSAADAKEEAMERT